MSDRVCSLCGTSNDGSRVYCKDCGARLPEHVESSQNAGMEPEVLTAGLTAPALPAMGSHRPPARRPLREAPPAKKGSFLVEIFQMAVLGFLLACIVQAARLPNGIPPAMPANSQAAANTFANLENCAQAGTLKSWPIALPLLNQFLASVAQESPDERVCVALALKEFRFFVVRNFFGRSICFSLLVVPDESEGLLQAQLKGASIGRLPVPSFLTRAILPQFQPALKRLGPSIGLVQKAQTVIITPTIVTLQWLGTRKDTP